MNFLSKLKFILKKPKMIIITGEGRKYTKKSIFQVLSRHPQAAKDILLSESDLKNPQDVEELKFLINKSSLFIFVISRIEEVEENKSSSSPTEIPVTEAKAKMGTKPSSPFAAARVKEAAQEIQKLAKMIPASGRLILNFDDQTLREMVGVTNLRTFTFGFQPGADFQVSDININGGTNFKINYKGSIVPVWLEGACGKEQIYAALAAACVATIFDLNLIEISQALKNN